MAYRCNRTGRECDGCMDCKPETPRETGVKIKVTLSQKYVVHGDIEKELRNGNRNIAEGMVEAIIDAYIDTCYRVGVELELVDYTMELNE